MGDHLREQRVAGDVEGHAEEHVAAALVELTRELAILHVELEERVAGRERDLVGLARIPPRHEEAAAARVGPDLLQQASDLIDAILRVAPVGEARGAEVAPLMAVHRPEIARAPAEARRLLRRRPLVPDADAGRLERGHVGLAAEEPQELVDDRPHVELLRRQERKPLAQIEAHLVPEDRARPRARAVLA